MVAMTLLHKSNPLMLRIAAVAVALPLVLGACDSGDDSGEDDNEQSKQQASESPTPVPRNDLAVTIEDGRCSPSRIEVESGEIASMLVSNQTKKPVVFVLPIRDVEISVKPKKGSRIEVMVEREEIDYTCRFANGSEFNGHIVPAET